MAAPLLVELTPIIAVKSTSNRPRARCRLPHLLSRPRGTALRFALKRRAHLAQPPHPLLDRRVRREEARDAAAPERLHEVEAFGRLAHLHRHCLRPTLQP